MLQFNCEKLLAPRPTHKLGDHPLSAVRECLQYTFRANLCICPHLRAGAMPWWYGPIYHC